MNKLILIAFFFQFQFANAALKSTKKAPVNLAKSTLRWEGSTILKKHFGSLKLSKGTHFDLKNGKPVSGLIEVDMSSINTEDLSGNLKVKLDGHLKHADFFDVAANPKATYKISSIKGSAFVGDFTIRGKTQKNVEVPYTRKGSSYKGKFTFDRTAYDMKYKSGKFYKDLADNAINDEIQISFELVMK